MHTLIDTKTVRLPLQCCLYSFPVDLPEAIVLRAFAVHGAGISSVYTRGGHCRNNSQPAAGSTYGSEGRFML